MLPYILTIYFLLNFCLTAFVYDKDMKFSAIVFVLLFGVPVTIVVGGALLADGMES